jgi:hypothetical protein
MPATIKAACFILTASSGEIDNDHRGQHQHDGKRRSVPVEKLNHLASC